MKGLNCVRILVASMISICLGESTGCAKVRLFYNPESTLINFHSNQGKLMRDQQLVDDFGRGCDGMNKRKYQVFKSSIVVEFDIDEGLITGIGLTTGTLSGNCVLKEKIGRLETGHGVKLGDDVGKVLKIYGSPTYVQTEAKIYRIFDQTVIPTKNYAMYYRDDVLGLEENWPNGIPPHSQMMIRICDGIVCEIGLVIFEWDKEGKIIPRTRRQKLYP